MKYFLFFSLTLLASPAAAQSSWCSTNCAAQFGTAMRQMPPQPAAVTDVVMTRVPVPKHRPKVH